MRTAAQLASTTLAFRGSVVQPEIFLSEDFFYNWKRQCTLTPISRAKVFPKLSKMGIPMTILDRLTSIQLTEVLCMVIVILYHCKVQDLGIPHYIPECYSRADLTAAMAMEKIRLISPAVHFNILRNMDFFTEDRLGICTSFYEIPVQ